jgi:hypothetical protein
LNLAIHHAAATPNNTFAGTAIAAVSNVSRIEDRASLSLNASKNGPNPLRNASVNTARSGNTRKNARKRSAMATSVQRTQAESCVAREVVDPVEPALR